MAVSGGFRVLRVLYRARVLYEKVEHFKRAINTQYVPAHFWN